MDKIKNKKKKKIFRLKGKRIVFFYPCLDKGETTKM